MLYIYIYIYIYVFSHPARKCYIHFLTSIITMQTPDTPNELEYQATFDDIAICWVIAENMYITHYTHRGIEFDTKNHSSDEYHLVRTTHLSLGL